MGNLLHPQRILDRTIRSASPESSGPIRVQFWWKDRWMGTAPIRIVDGKPDDLKYRPKQPIYFDRLVFVHPNRKAPFVHRLGKTYRAEAGQLIRLYLGHLKLTDQFGINVLG